MALLICIVIVVGVMAFMLKRDAERRAALAAEMARIEEDARTQPGCAPDRPFEVEASSVIEGHVRGVPCPICGESLRLDQHTAETIHGERMRLVLVTCAVCGSSRTLYYKIRAKPS
jgi:hypothetical protein